MPEELQADQIETPIVDSQEVEPTQQIEIIVPQKRIIDETEGKIPSKFEKVIEEEGIDSNWETVITRKIVPMTESEAIEKRTAELKFKVAIGTATTTDKADLKLLIG